MTSSLKFQISRSGSLQSKVKHQSTLICSNGVKTPLRPSIHFASESVTESFTYISHPSILGVFSRGVRGGKAVTSRRRLKTLLNSFYAKHFWSFKYVLEVFGCIKPPDIMSERSLLMLLLLLALLLLLLLLWISHSL